MEGTTFDSMFIDDCDLNEEPTVDISRLIHFGKENAIDRYTLADITGLTDRQVRYAIAEARKKGKIIINTGDGKGYYQSDDIDEIEREYRKERKRALSILMRLKQMRRVLKENNRI